LADVELTGVIADDHGVRKEAVRLGAFGEKQASGGLVAAGSSRFVYYPSGLGAHLGRFLLLRKTGERSVRTGDLSSNIRRL
jgi:hypothetical protein